MKTVITLLAFVLLSGCGTYQSLEQLQAEAMLTGDWSAVELRERQLARRNQKRGIDCPMGEVGYCIVEFGSQRCACVERDLVRSFFSY